MKFIAIIASVALLFGSVARPAYADHLPAIMPCIITTSAPTQCFNTASYGGVPGVLYGIVNNALVAQVQVKCYDNASAASGPVVASVDALPPNTSVTWPAGGRLFIHGLTCQANGTPTGAGIEIYAGSSNA